MVCSGLRVEIELGKSEVLGILKRKVCQSSKATVLTLPLHYQILIIKSSSLIQLKNEIVLTFVV